MPTQWHFSISYTSHFSISGRGSARTCIDERHSAKEITASPISRGATVDFTSWSTLSERERKATCQQLNPYENEALFKAVESEFKRQYGSIEAVEKVFCGIGGGLGGANALCVTIRKGAQRASLPKFFLGFTVLRLAVGHTRKRFQETQRLR
jgi:hypothetical protein